MTGPQNRRPEEGWLTLLLVAGLVAIVATVVDDPAWVNGRGKLTDGLLLFGMLGVAVGFIGPKVGWGRWTTHLVGALFAGLLIPIIVGWYAMSNPSIGAAFHETAKQTIEAYLDLAWRNRKFTNQELHYVLVLGIILWGTGQFAAYAVFGHRRPLNAVIMTGIVLLANMSMTSRQEQELPYLVLFTAGSLFLLIQMHAFDERATWIRRRIGDPSTISSLYLRGGTVFIVAALVGSLVLTTRAASSPLAGAWDGVHDQLIDLGESIGRFLPVGGDAKGSGVNFGSGARIAGKWFSDDNTAFTAVLPPGIKKGLYWRAITFNSFDLGGWSQTNLRDVPVPAGDPLMVGTAENPQAQLTNPVQFTIRPADFSGNELLSLGTPVVVDQPSTVKVAGAQGWFGAAELPAGTGDYSVKARVLRLDETSVISGNRLIAAPEVYPDEIHALYTDVPDDALGPDARELLAQVKLQAKSSDPYDLAQAIVRILGNKDVYHYQTDVTDLECDSPSQVECFARYKRGYCLHYASTMAMLLRAANPANPIPTRLVEGFLPGDRVGNVETVKNKGAHAWVEVWFRGFGWIPFDPTGPGVGLPTQIQDGPKVPAVPPPSFGDLSGAFGPDFTPPGRPTGGRDQFTPINQPGDRTLFIVLTALLVLLVGGVALAAWLRGPRGEISPDRAWQSMSRAASQLGYRRRANQTVYEYASSLAELVPVATADLNTVAEAKVQTAYARVRLDGDRLQAVGQATRRLRITLLRLAFRRGRRVRRRRPKSG